MLQGGRLTSFIICSKPDIFFLTSYDQAWFFDNPLASVIDPSHEPPLTVRNEVKRGMTGEAKFLCWKFPVVKPNFVIFFDEVLQTYHLKKIWLLDTYKYCQSNQKFSSQS